VAAEDHFAIGTRPAWCAVTRTDRVGGAQCKSVTAPIDVPPFDRANVDAISRPGEMVALTKRRSGRVLAADVSSPFVAVVAGLVDSVFKDRLREEVPKNLERILSASSAQLPRLCSFGSYSKSSST
jgi:hypothetical protein